MEIKSVRILDQGEQKSVQEIEQELLDKHEKEQEGQHQDEPQNNEPTDNEEQDDLSEEKVLSYIGKRYNKQINSFEELMSERNESEQLPEDVAAYMKYKKETGRGFEDFLKLKKDFDSMDSEDLLKEYLSSTQQGLDQDDIETLMDDFRYDEDIDDEASVKKIKIARKKAIAEAKRFFTEQKEKYKLPLESSGLGISKEEQEEFDAYKQYTKEAKTVEEENNRKRQWFSQKTNELFNNDFKGFEFNVNDKKIVFSPGDVAELKKVHANPSSFVTKFLDENGLVKDSAGYHRSLAIAMNPDKFAKFFYEQGKSDATDDVMRKTKNINMSERKAPDVIKPKDGVQVRAVNPDSGRSLKIRSIKRI